MLFWKSHFMYKKYNVNYIFDEYFIMSFFLNLQFDIIHVYFFVEVI